MGPSLLGRAVQVVVEPRLSVLGEMVLFGLGSLADRGVVSRMNLAHRGRLLVAVPFKDAFKAICPQKDRVQRGLVEFFEGRAAP